MALNNQPLSLVELHNKIPFEVNMQKHNGSVYLIVDGTYSLFYIMDSFKVTVFHVQTSFISAIDNINICTPSPPPPTKKYIKERVDIKECVCVRMH